jgi:dTDP-4-dehydrorhamnose 3,5-epimerase-like enzyme
MKIKNLKEMNSHIDGRGTIQMILESCEIGSISRIDSVAGATRANHWHKHDTHWILVNSGQIEYYERELNADRKPDKYVLNEGDMIFTESGWEHSMYFSKDTSFECYSKLKRTSENYESETVRFEKSLKDVYEQIS